METTTQTRTHADVVLNEDQSVSITVPSTNLTQAITWVAPAASKDSDRGGFSGINITYGPAEEHVPHYDPTKQWQRKPVSGYALTLAATDRYRLHWSTLVVPTVEDRPSQGQWDTPSGSLTLPAKELAAISKTWPKPTRATGGMPYRVRITFTPGQPQSAIRLEVLEPVAEQVISSQSLREPETNSFPKYTTLVPVPDNSHSSADVAFNPEFLADMAAAANKLKVSGMAFHLPAAQDKGREQVRRACLVTLNDPEASVSHSAILMPVKL